jgi:hypothetical protein
LNAWHVRTIHGRDRGTDLRRSFAGLARSRLVQSCHGTLLLSIEIKEGTMSRVAVRELDDRFDAARRRVPTSAASRAHVCVSCHEKRSVFRYHGAVRADRDHTLCFRCYRALRDSVRARFFVHAA